MQKKKPQLMFVTRSETQRLFQLLIYPIMNEEIHNGDLDHFCKKSILVLGERYFDSFASLKE